MNSSSRFAHWFLALAFVAGCNSNKPDLVDVSGTVTRGGKPVPSLVIQFRPADDRGRDSWGLTDAEGKFKLTFSKQYSGALRGKHKVFVTFKDDAAQFAKETGQAVAAVPTEQAAIVAKYGSAETSPLVIDLPEDTETLEVKLD